jgi:hypothetical protein
VKEIPNIWLLRGAYVAPLGFLLVLERFTSAFGHDLNLVDRVLDVFLGLLFVVGCLCGFLLLSKLILARVRERKGLDRDN